MRDFLLFLLVIVGIAAVIWNLVLRSENTDLEARLEAAEAIAATGLCGNKFLVVLEKGDNRGKVAVAGHVLPADQAGNYFQAKGPDGVEEVYVSVDQGRETRLIFRRIPATGCPATR